MHCTNPGDHYQQRGEGRREALRQACREGLHHQGQAIASRDGGPPSTFGRLFMKGMVCL